MGTKARARSAARLERLKVLDEIRAAPPAKLRKILRAFGKECYELGYGNGNGMGQS